MLGSNLILMLVTIGALLGAISFVVMAAVQRRDLQPTSAHPSPVAITEFRKRVHTARSRAFGLLTSIAIALALGILLFLSADQVSAGRSLYRVPETIEAVQIDLKSIENILSQDSLPTSADDRVKLERRQAQERARLQLESITSSLVELNEHITREEAAYKSELLDFIRVTLIRLGVIVLLVYICQILLRLYRYYLQIADFYQALVDVLLHHKEWGLTLPEAFKFTHPEYDVGRNPRTPMQEAIKWMEKVKVSPSIDV